MAEMNLSSSFLLGPLVAIICIVLVPTQALQTVSCPTPSLMGCHRRNAPPLSWMVSEKERNGNKAGGYFFSGSTRLQAHAPWFIVAFPTYFNDLETGIDEGGDIKHADKSGAETVAVVNNMEFPPLSELASSPLPTEGHPANSLGTIPSLGELSKSFEATLTEQLLSEPIVEKEQLLEELNSLTATFEELQSSIDVKSRLFSDTLAELEGKIARLEETNRMQEDEIKVMSLALEEREQPQITISEEQLNNINIDDKSDGVSEDDDVQAELSRVLEDIKRLENENENLRLRVRGLEMELSDVAFESRKITSQVVAKELEEGDVLSTAKVSEVTESENSPVETKEASTRSIQVSPTILSVAGTDASCEEGTINKHVPKAPKAPIPQHVQQKYEIENLQSQIKEYDEERSSFRTLLRLCLKTGLRKVGKGLMFWK